MKDGWDSLLAKKSPQFFVFFSKNCMAAQKASILRVTSFSKGLFPIKYLGVPVVIGRLTARHLQSLEEKIRSKIAGWKLDLLSQGG